MLPHITKFMKHISSSVWKRVVARPERFVTLTTNPSNAYANKIAQSYPYIFIY